MGSTSSPRLESVVSSLRTDSRTVWVSGPEWADLSEIVSQQLGLEHCRVDLKEAVTPTDGWLALGEGVGVMPQGDQSALVAHFRTSGPTLMVVVDARSFVFDAVWSTLVEVAPNLRWLLVGRSPPLGGESLNAPVVVKFGGAVEEKTARINRKGIDADAELARLSYLLPVGLGAPIPKTVSWKHAVALRELACTLAHPDEASHVRATAARLFAAWGQASVARSILDEGLASAQDHVGSGVALLWWAKADMRAMSGDRSRAEEEWATAEEMLQKSGDLKLLGVFLQQRAMIFSLLGDAEEALQGYRQARLLCRRVGDAVGVAVALRGAADVGVARGEVLSAELLFDQADATQVPVVELINRRLGQAGLAIAQGNWERARTRLKEAEVLAGPEAMPILNANVDLRTAQLCMMEGNLKEALVAVDRAIHAYGSVGEFSAMALALRLAGDCSWQTVGEDGASSRYRKAIALQIRMRDPKALMTTLHHAGLFTRWVGDLQRADALEILLDTLEDEVDPPRTQ